MKALEWSQHSSPYESKEIFPDAKGQLTLQPEVWPGRSSNLSEILWLSLLSARIKKIQSKIKALELVCLFYLIWFLRPINNISIKQGRVFLDWTSTKLG